MSLFLNCKTCGESFRAATKHTLYCQGKCHPRSLARKRSYSNRQYIGKLSELRVSIDLVGKGYEVFHSLISLCSCDFMVIKSNKILRVEVKTWLLKRHPNVKSAFDILALVNHQGEIRYLNEKYEPIEI